MKKATRQRLLIACFVLLLLGAAVAGYLYWEPALLSLLALLAWSKKLFTISGMLMLAKKLPLMLLVGSKKLVIKAFGSLLVFSARTRFRFIRRAIIRLKLTVRRTLHRVRYHWGDMESWERLIIYISFVPLLAATLLVLLLFAFVPRYVRTLLLRKVQESTAASIIDKGIPAKARAAVEKAHCSARSEIRQKLIPERERSSDD